MLWGFLAMTTSLSHSAMAPSDLDRFLRHLGHEIRQPLSSIESIAYYLDMVLGECGPEIQVQCAHLRRMVHQTNWLLEDTTLAIRTEYASHEAVQLEAHFRKLGADLALHEERNLELVIEDGLPPIQLPAGLTYFFCEHLIRFFREVSQAGDPIVIALSRELGNLRADISAEIQTDVEEMRRILDPPEPGGTRRFITAAGGTMNVTAQAGSLELRILFPGVN